MGRPPPRSLPLVVVGASAGGLGPLKTLLSDLTPDFPAAILVVFHLSPGRASHLASVLGHSGPLPAVEAAGGTPIMPGRIYVAPPDHHLLVRDGCLRVDQGAHHNGLRPAADVLFESAAEECGSRTIGVVLSGLGRDGSSGLAAIRTAGGRAVVQDPADCEYDSMPRSALEAVEVDACVPASELAPTITALLRKRTRTVPVRRRHKVQEVFASRVLLVEDDSLLASEISAMLRSCGCETVGPARDVARALRILEETGGRIDCAVLDVDLRGKRAFRIAEALHRRHVPIVVATGLHVGDLGKWSAFETIEKPFDAAALKRAMVLALGRRDQARGKHLPRPPPTTSDGECIRSTRNLIMASRLLLQRKP